MIVQVTIQNVRKREGEKSPKLRDNKSENNIILDYLVYSVMAVEKVIQWIKYWKIRLLLLENHLI